MLAYTIEADRNAIVEGLALFNAGETKTFTEQDAEAFFEGLDKLASAKTVTEAFQIQSELIRARSEAFVTRAKSSTEYLSKLAANSAKTAQDNFSKVYSKTA